MRSVTVVGASLAGLSAVRSLRAQGFDGRVVVVGGERHLPYDRPPLSKGFLTGATSEADLGLLVDGDDALDVEWRLGTLAAGLDAATRTLHLADGSAITSDGVVLATGSRARQLPGTESLTGVHVLRSLDDAIALRDDLSRAASLVVVGAGFIGAEVASSARSLGLEVTVVEAMPTPLAGPLGPEMGAAVGALHADHGVRLLTGTGVARLVGRSSPDGPARVEGVELLDGTLLPADVVLVGVGAAPNVEWLAGSGLEVAGGVATDATGATAAPGIVAVGDCALALDARTGRPHRSEHWTHALQQPASAVATLLGTPTPHTALPYFWSEQYGLQVQLVGSRAAGDEVTVVHGSVEDRAFVATYERAGELVAVLGVGAPGPFNRWRRTLRTQAAALAPAVLAG